MLDPVIFHLSVACFGERNLLVIRTACLPLRCHRLPSLRVLYRFRALGHGMTYATLASL